MGPYFVKNPCRLNPNCLEDRYGAEHLRILSCRICTMKPPKKRAAACTNAVIGSVNKLLPNSRGGCVAQQTCLSKPAATGFCPRAVCSIRTCPAFRYHGFLHYPPLYYPLKFPHDKSYLGIVKLNSSKQGEFWEGWYNGE